MIKKIKKLIDKSGKRGFVTYKGKDKRIAFDESVTSKKLEQFKNFVGDKTEDLLKVLTKK
ncbi:hypothetical protein [Chryseobacterium sp.]|uniref:hypothetical protein n=1 Tax=Chryseobacterium sp. TaxID=1871047 RepID=UPI0028A12E1B|nr:hypothetical protein [Chryseobacterium sp.]